MATSENTATQFATALPEPPPSTDADGQPSTGATMLWHGSCSQCHHLHTAVPITFNGNHAHQRIHCEHCGRTLFGLGRRSTQTTLASVLTSSSWRNDEDHTAAPTGLLDPDDLLAPHRVSSPPSPLTPSFGARSSIGSVSQENLAESSLPRPDPSNIDPHPVGIHYGTSSTPSAGSPTTPKSRGKLRRRLDGMLKVIKRRSAFFGSSTTQSNLPSPPQQHFISRVDAETVAEGVQGRDDVFDSTRPGTVPLIHHPPSPPTSDDQQDDGPRDNQPMSSKEQRINAIRREKTLRREALRHGTNSGGRAEPPRQPDDSPIASNSPQAPMDARSSFHSERPSSSASRSPQPFLNRLQHFRFLSTHLVERPIPTSSSARESSINLEYAPLSSRQSTSTHLSQATTAVSGSDGRGSSQGQRSRSRIRRRQNRSIALLPDVRLIFSESARPEIAEALRRLEEVGLSPVRRSTDSTTDAASLASPNRQTTWYSSSSDSATGTGAASGLRASFASLSRLTTGMLSRRVSGEVEHRPTPITEEPTPITRHEASGESNRTRSSREQGEAANQSQHSLSRPVDPEALAERLGDGAEGR